MKKYERNLCVIENFIGWLTHCDDERDKGFNEPMPFVPRDIYRALDVYLVEDHADGMQNPELTERDVEANKMLLENFVLHFTHCGNDDTERDFDNELLFTPKSFYDVAEDYIEYDHVDGKENEENFEEV